MIDTARPMVERQHADRAPALEPMRCSRCGNAVALVHLEVGSVVQIRCHHKIERGGKSVKCGWVTRVQPTR